ncbi:MAG: VCBS repeat-containing protein [Deltaproteobacteria bacterium]|nr:VCBS repeat-containing protein [Deltaproteobacteria bacterium]
MITESRRVIYLLVAGLSFAGCAASSGTKAGSQGPIVSVTNAPQYTPARDGLPKGKIWKSQIAFGDIDGDGFPDLGTVSRLADGPWIWRNDGHGHWTSASEGLPREPFCGGGMDFGDVNRDGKMDVAIADHCKGVFVYSGDGNGKWTSASAGLPTIGCEDIALGDFNGDGCLDVATVAASEEGVRAFLGNCKGVWRESSSGLANNEWGNSVAVADMNKDGKLDIIAAYSAGPRVWLGDGKGGWKEASEGLPAPEVHGLYWGIAVGDVNGDGLLDIAATDQSRGAEIFLQTADGKYVQTSTRQCADGVNSGAYCGVDSDCAGATCSTSVCKGVCSAGTVGRPCLTDSECNEVGSNGLTTKSGICSMGPKVGTACTSGGPADQCAPGACAAVSNGHGIPPMNALGVTFGDLNNDGKLDLVVAGKTNMEEIGGVYGVFAMLGDGKGNFTLLKNVGLPDGGWERTWGAGVADVDRDGVLDIAVAFGDVLPPAWRSGAMREQKAAQKAEKKEPGFFAKLFGSKKNDKDDKSKKASDSAAPAPPKAPERGFFGSIEVWRGQLSK